LIYVNYQQIHLDILVIWARDEDFDLVNKRIVGGLVQINKITSFFFSFYSNSHQGDQTEKEKKL